MSYATVVRRGTGTEIPEDGRRGSLQLTQASGLSITRALQPIRTSQSIFRAKNPKRGRHVSPPPSPPPLFIPTQIRENLWYVWVLSKEDPKFRIHGTHRKKKGGRGAVTDATPLPIRTEMGNAMIHTVVSLLVHGR